MAVNVYDELLWLRAEVERLSKLVRLRLQLAVPSYFRPGTLWDTLLAKGPAITCINPGSGPGLTASSSYQAQVPKAKASGTQVFGYVYTQYGNRPLVDVKADVDKHFAWYGVTGIFFDQGANTLDKVPYYTDLFNYVRAKGGRVVLNPGTRTITEYAAIADHLMVAETDLATYRTRPEVAWERDFPATKFWHCIHSCPAASVPEVIELARNRNAGLLHVTDDVMPNPYDTLPTYLDALVGGL